MATAPEIANNAGDPEDEELMDVPEAEKASDPLFRAEIERVLDGTVFRGVVEEIEMGVVTKEKLYRIRYEDNDMEHFSAEQVLELRVQPKETSASQPLKRPADASAEEPVAKKPAVAGTADDAADAADESDGNVDAEEEEEEEEEANDSNDVSKKPAGAGAKTNGVLDEADEAENEGEEEEEEEEDEEEDEQMEENGSSARQKPASADIAKKPSADAGDDEDATSTKKPASAVLKKPAADHGHIDMEEEEEETPPKVMKKPASRGAR